MSLSLNMFIINSKKVIKMYYFGTSQTRRCKLPRFDFYDICGLIKYSIGKRSSLRHSRVSSCRARIRARYHFIVAINVNRGTYLSI